MKTKGPTAEYRCRLVIRANRWLEAECRDDPGEAAYDGALRASPRMRQDDEINEYNYEQDP